MWRGKGEKREENTKNICIGAKNICIHAKIVVSLQPKLLIDE